MWADFFRDGGIGMFPTALFGLFLIASAVRLVLRPERRRAVLTAVLGLLTFAMGALGTTAGLITTFRYVARVTDEDPLRTAAVGCAESLNNAVLALMLCSLALLLAAVSALRVARGSSGGLEAEAE